MIDRLKGILVEKNPPQAVIDVNDVGYEADVSMQTFYRLPVTDETMQLYTQLVVYEDAYLLFGFATADEHATFRQPAKVSGTGARTALGTLSAMSVDKPAQAITKEDVRRLSSASSIDKGVAECMVLELRSKSASAISDGPAVLSVAADGIDDIVDTLLTLGHSECEAKAAVKGLPRGTDVGKDVWLALKNLLK